MTQFPPRSPAPFADHVLSEALGRIAEALERLAPLPPARPDFGAAEAFIWQAAP